MLGFNEPERESQGNLTVEQALEHWPKLEKLAKREKLLLGSPAPSSDLDGVAWLNQFMKGANERGYKIDFLAFHWYRSIKLERFKKELDKLAQKHQLKIWLTEFNGAFADASKQAEFLEGALKYLEESPNIGRYAYFNPKPQNPAALLDENKKLTRLGEIYRDIKSL